VGGFEAHRCVALLGWVRGASAPFTAAIGA
jgi:hypothetical protein